jgi:putative HD superfamily hydrolase of NAD metabolism
MITAKECENLVKSTLSEERAYHTFCVRDMAVQLAKVYGADKEKAEVAALLHDICKENTDEENLRLIMHSDIMKTVFEGKPSYLLHGPAAAAFAEKMLNIHDDEILSAIACHTTAKENMSLMDKMLYIADKTSRDRDYPEAECYRNMALNGNLYEVLILIVEDVLLNLRGKVIEEDDTTAKALQFLKREKAEGI